MTNFSVAVIFGMWLGCAYVLRAQSSGVEACVPFDHVVGTHCAYHSVMKC